MLFKAYNKSLIDDREKTYLTAAVAAAATTLTIVGVDTNAWADNDYLIIGEIGSKNAEIMQANGAVSDGTSLTIDRSGAAGGTRFAHAINEPVYRIDYNRVEFNRNTTDSTSGVTVLATNEIQPDDLFTRYEDTANTTGYGFFRFNNQTSGAFSSYSDGVNYELIGNSSSKDPRTLWMMRRRVRKYLNELDDTKLKDDMIDETINDKQKDIAHAEVWSFYEGERSLSLVANQFAYDIPAAVNNIYNIRVDTQPLISMNKNQWDLAHFDTNTTSSDPSHSCVWNRQMLIYPRPGSADSTTTINVGGGISATATSVTVTATSAFNRGDYYRFIIDSEVIYATASTATTFTGLLRGREGTTGATHANAATITERSMVYSTQEEPVLLVDTQDRTNIPEPDLISLAAAIELAPLVNKEDLLTQFKEEYKDKFKQLKNKYAVKNKGHFSRVKGEEELITGGGLVKTNPNLYPRDITGTS